MKNPSALASLVTKNEKVTSTSDYNQKILIKSASINNLVEFGENHLLTDAYLLEACAFYRFQQQWNCWICCSCSRTFNDSESYFLHVAKTHIKNSLPVDCSLVLPPKIDWVMIINHGNWEPADVSAAFAVFEERLQSQPQAREFEIEDYFFGESWVLSHDPKRAKLLKMIQSRFQHLLSAKVLIQLHLEHVICCAISQLQTQFPWGQLTGLGLNKTQLCICLLGVLDLQKVLAFLDQIDDYSSKVLEETPNIDELFILYTKDFMKKIDLVMEEEHDMLYVFEKGSKEKPKRVTSWFLSGKNNSQSAHLWKTTIIDRGVEEHAQMKNKFEDMKRLNTDEWMLEFLENIHLSKSRINSLAAADYREPVLFLLEAHELYSSKNNGSPVLTEGEQSGYVQGEGESSETVEAGATQVMLDGQQKLRRTIQPEEGVSTEMLDEKTEKVIEWLSDVEEFQKTVQSHGEKGKELLKKVNTLEQKLEKLFQELLLEIRMLKDIITTHGETTEKLQNRLDKLIETGMKLK